MQDIERLDGVAVLVEADRTTQSGEAGELGHVIADLGAIGLEVFRLAGHAAGLDRFDINADDLIDIGVVHAGFDFRRQTAGLAQQRLQRDEGVAKVHRGEEIVVLVSPRLLLVD